MLGDDGLLPEVSDLISDWQEQLAIADDGITPQDQEAMMRQWQDMVDAKENSLRRQKRRDISDMLPAHLTGWMVFDEAGQTSALSIDDNAPQDDDDAEDSAAFDGLLEEAEQEDADVADASFVAEWQLYAEKARATTRGAPAASRPASFLDRWFDGRARGNTAEPTGSSAVGIDLGTTNCAIAAVLDGQPQILPTEDGEPIFPSIVSFLSAAPGELDSSLPAPLLQPNNSMSKVLVGDAARRQCVINPHSTYSSTKRLIGRTASAAELKQLCALDVPHSLNRATREVLLACPALGRAISPVSVAAELIRSLVGQAEARLQHDVTSAVVTVPAYFDDSQRCATETACLLAGLQQVRLLREPEAAALSYAIGQREESRIMVFDLGGGTFDVSILDVGSGIIEVVASSGDPRLGGNDWDQVVAQWLEDLFVKEHATPVDGFGRRRLLDAAETAKFELSEATSTQVDVPFLVGDKGISVTLSRRKFEALTRHLVLRLVAPMQEACDMAGIKLDESKMGTLVKGGLANAAPRVQQWQQQVAWRWRRLAQRTSYPGLPATPPTSGVPISRVLLVGGATRMPCIGRFIKRVTGLPAKPTVNPEEAVALGAAVQAGILDGRIAQRVFNPYQHDRTASNLADDPNVRR